MISGHFGVTGKVALVTGGRRGISLPIASGPAESGSKGIIGVRSQEGVSQAFAQANIPVAPVN